MKTGILVYLLIFVLTPFNSNLKKSDEAMKGVVYLQKDKEIAEKVLKQFRAEKNISTAELVMKIGLFFIETPYVAHTLEFEPEQLVINLRELDCTTFAESSLALAMTIKESNPTFEKYCANLQNLRYYNGEITNYTSRIHYFSDWIFENSKRDFVADVSGEIGQTPYPLNVGFMSTHPESYKQLAGNSSFVTIIAEKEKYISTRKMFYIPEDKLSEVESYLKDGDIVGITTNMKGLDISHVGILVRKNNRIHLLNASSISMKVELTEGTLEEYLKNSKSSNGIMVARPL